MPDITCQRKKVPTSYQNVKPLNIERKKEQLLIKHLNWCPKCITHMMLLNLVLVIHCCTVFQTFWFSTGYADSANIHLLCSHATKKKGEERRA